MAQGKDPRLWRLLADSGSKQGTAKTDWKDLRPIWVVITKGPDEPEPRVFFRPSIGIDRSRFEAT